MTSPLFAFDNTYAALPDRFYARLDPTPVAAPRLIRVNAALARTLGLDAAALRGPEGVAALAGVRPPEGAAPLAMAYAGHQFGGFTPQLGDGRAILLGEVVGRDGARRDVQLKGSGRTPFSRNGDGRAAVGPVLREYIVSEAMHRLGVPTTRALAAALTGERVLRERGLPGAVLTRVAASHVRVGTFQYFAARKDADAVRRLADYVIARHYPAAAQAENTALALLAAVGAAQAALVARWMALGFVHGVMNTDNMSIAGETIDYGPCAFIDAFDPNAVFSSIDHYGRYAYSNQPRVAQWNLSRLGQALLTAIDADIDAAVTAAQAVIDAWPDRFAARYRAAMGAKFGLDLSAAATPDAPAPKGATSDGPADGAPADGAATSDGPADDDDRLIQDFLDLMAAAKADFTLTFRRLNDCAVDAAADPALAALFSGGDGPSDLSGWLARWRARLAREDAGAVRAAMAAANPTLIPRNHQVEAVIAAATDDDDFAPFHALVDALDDPFDAPPDSPFAAPPKAHEVVRQTFLRDVRGRPTPAFCARALAARRSAAA